MIAICVDDSVSVAKKSYKAKKWTSRNPIEGDVVIEGQSPIVVREGRSLLLPSPSLSKSQMGPLRTPFHLRFNSSLC